MITGKLKTLDNLVGEHNMSGIKIRQKFMKEIVASHVKIPKIKPKNNMNLLVKNLKDNTERKASETRSDVIVFPAYRSHRLLIKMEEKEQKYKQLQRIKELSNKGKRNTRRNSEHPRDFHNLSQEELHYSTNLSELNQNTSSTLDGSIFKMVGKTSNVSSNRPSVDMTRNKNRTKVDESGE